MLDIALAPPVRSKWGTPKIDGEWGWRRPSTLAKTLDDQSALIDWKARTVAKGIVSQDHLIAAASAAPLTDRGQWRDIMEQGLAASGGTKGRTMGTAIHTATEEADHGRDISHLPESVFNDVSAYKSALRQHDIEPMAAELFVVCDELRAAGSFDRIVRHRESGRWAIADIKTGKPDAPKYGALNWAIQIAIYSAGVPFCNDRGRLTWEEVGLEPPNPDFGVVAHIVPGSGRCELLQVNLKAGLRYAELACEVYAARRDKTLLEEI